jgi:hypothetical protein
MEYNDNLTDENISFLDTDIRKMKKADGWLPFEAYDMCQCGYPYPDHGEMIRRPDGGINQTEELLPSKGMWCKVEDAMKIINSLKK